MRGAQDSRLKQPEARGRLEQQRGCRAASCAGRAWTAGGLCQPCARGPGLQRTLAEEWTRAMQTAKQHMQRAREMRVKATARPLSRPGGPGSPTEENLWPARVGSGCSSSSSYIHSCHRPPLPPGSQLPRGRTHAMNHRRAPRRKAVLTPAARCLESTVSSMSQAPGATHLGCVCGKPPQAAHRARSYRQDRL